MKIGSKHGGILAAMSLLGAMAFVGVPDALCQIARSLRFVPDVVDFGIIGEDAGKVSRTVKAVNVSADSTYIASARTGCGCTVAEFPDDMIAPGDTVTISVTYDTTNRPGQFLKTVKFITGSDRISNSLKIKGSVRPSRESVERMYPAEAGPLRLSTPMVNAGGLTRNDARPLFVSVYNSSDAPVALQASSDALPLEAALAPDTVAPYGISTLSLMLKGRLLPRQAADFAYKAYLIDAASGDTLAAIPVGGFIKDN